MNCYRIRNWDTLYENNRTRELKVMQWVPIPVKLSGDGYTLMLEQKNGEAMYGAWIACVNVAATCDPRGTLVRGSGESHTVASLSRITRFKKSTIEDMVRFCLGEPKWLEIIELESGATISHEGATISHDPALNGREWKGREGNTHMRSRGRVKTFKPPTLEEFKEYCKEHGFESIAERAYHGYSEANWHDSKGKPVLVWKQKLQQVWFDENNRDKRGGTNYAV